MAQYNPNNTQKVEIMKQIEQDFINKLVDDLIDTVNRNSTVFSTEMTPTEIGAGVMVALTRFVATATVQMDALSTYVGEPMTDDQVVLTQSNIFNQLMIAAPRVVAKVIKAHEGHHADTV